MQIDDNDVSIQRKLLGLVYRQMQTTLIGELFFFILILAAFWTNSNKIMFILWFLSSVFIVVTSYLIIYQSHKQIITNSINIEAANLTIIVIVLGNGICFGVMGSMFMPHLYPVEKMLILASLLGVTALANVILSPVKNLYLIFLIPAYFPHIIWLFTQGDTYVYVGIAAIIYFLLMVRYSNNIHTMISQAVHFEVDNLKLIHDLEIQNKQLLIYNDDIRDLEESMELINNINHKLQLCLNIDELFIIIKETVPYLFSKCSGGIAIYDNEEHTVQTKIQWGEYNILESEFSCNDCWAIRSSNLYQSNNYNKKIDCYHFTRDDIKISLCIPLLVAGKVSGIISICDHSGEVLNHHKQQQLAITLAEVVALSITNINLRNKLRKQAIHDPLTGLFNRRYLEETLSIELQRIARNNGVITIAMVDIDFFKKFNDEYGHEAGDEVLKELGSLLIDNFRGSDVAYRYGGEEFLVILKDSNIEDSYHRLDEFRKKLKNITIIFNGKTLPKIAVSIGIAEALKDGKTTDEIIGAADVALYAAKQEGRDRINIYNKNKSSDQK